MLQLKESYQRLLDGRSLAVVIVIRSIEGANDPKGYQAGFLDALKKKNKDIKIERVTSPLGEGQAYLLSVDVEKKKHKVRIELYPFDLGCLLFRLEAEQSGFSTALPEFVKARKSLKRIQS